MDVPNRAEHPNRKVGSFNAPLTAMYVSGHPKMRDISEATYQERMSSSNLDTVANANTHLDAIASANTIIQGNKSI